MGDHQVDTALDRESLTPVGRLKQTRQTIDGGFGSLQALVRNTGM
jgi:hypothetical protein